MSTGTKLLLAAALLVAAVSAFGLRFDTTTWALVAAYWVWKHARLEQDYDNLRTGRQARPGEYRVTVRTDAFERFVEAIDHLPPPPSPDHYSVGGTRPHMCICGKPIKEHR